ncbi:fluoride efflux transporter FluC [Virgibacillus dokdonensis]|uniref:Fluoride-specific ion channel FluC n=1 Tax=Virgibacillus dokdonensis TaxID=302167 RepID=A0A2K9IZK3_9BACI|nr:CrcB family protein [Virgibacillus dokdonensis]AUJ23181.1 Putative fluoride ion transporter CrcB [Virgibacillus dokdonensis]
MHVSKNIKLVTAIGLGGAVGAMGRYSLTFIFSTDGFPFATLSANLLGCFLLSYLLHHKQIKKHLPPTLFTALTTGLIGSFTTFSTFTVETIELWNSHFFLAITYVLLSIAGGLLFCYIGYLFSIHTRKKARI